MGMGLYLASEGMDLRLVERVLVVESSAAWIKSQKLMTGSDNMLLAPESELIMTAAAAVLQKLL